MHLSRHPAPVAALTACLLAAELTLSGCRPEEPPPEGPPLIVFLVVDQMRYDYLERFGPLFSGGIARLLAEGTSFERAYHDHALTTTAPGHATLATGRHPSSHGIVNNGWWDVERGEWRYAVEDDRHDRSPRALQASTLGDWLQAAYPRSKVFTASGKDRSAILLGGRGAGAAFWYDRDEGGFTSSSYYRQGDPEWLAAFNDPPPADAFFATLWEPLPAAAAAGPELGIEVLDRGLFADTFPHPLGGMEAAPDEGFYHALYDTPFVDRLLADFARVLVENEGLGDDPYPDLLGLSFSAVDTVGHDWGPNSPELLDTLLRLDRALGELLDFLDQRIGLDRVLISLSSDHGVVPLPEYRRLVGLPGRRIDAATVACIQSAGRRTLASPDGEEGWLNRYGVWDEAALTAAGTTVEEADTALRQALEACPGVVRLWTRRELADGEAAGDPVGALFARSFHPGRSTGLVLQLEDHFLPYRSLGTTHGSPYDYDRHVPWLLRRPGGVGGGRVGTPVATVDVAPTLAALAGIPVAEELDGVDRSGLLTAAEAAAAGGPADRPGPAPPPDPRGDGVNPPAARP